MVAEQLDMPLTDARQMRRGRPEVADDAKPSEPSEDKDGQALIGADRREHVDRAATDALRSVANELAREVGLCIRYYSVTFRGKRPEPIFVTGGESNQPQMLDMLVESTPVGIERVEATDQIDLSIMTNLSESDKDLSRWTVALAERIRQGHAGGGMNKINFLSELYSSPIIRQRGVRREIVPLSLVAVCILRWYITKTDKEKFHKAHLASLQQKRAATEAHKTEGNRRPHHIDSLRQQQYLQRQLTQPIQLSSIIASLSHDMPSAVAIGQMTLHRKRPPLDESKDTLSTPDNADVKPWKHLHVYIRGFSPSGPELAALIGVLEDNPVFESIMMSDSRPTEKHNVIARGFNLEMHVPFDRDYLPVSGSSARQNSTTTRKVAHAD